MGYTLRDYREKLSKKLGGYSRGTVSLDPDPLDTLGQRSIISASLYDADKGSKGFSGHFAWVGRYKDSRRCRDDGYRSLAYGLLTPPSSGSFTLTFYGYGTTSAIDHAASAATIQSTITGSTTLPNVTVTQSGSQFIIQLSDIIDVQASAGTMGGNGGLGAVEVNRAFTSGLVTGDEYEIVAKLPVTDLDDFEGLNSIINNALRHMLIIDRFPITPGNASRVGQPTFYGLTNYPWLRSSKQLIAFYASTQWALDTTFTPPLTGSYTLLIDMGITSYTTASLAYNATGAQIQTALINAAGTALGLTVTPLGTSSSFVLSIASTMYASPTITTSSGTTVNVRTMRASPARAATGWKFQYDAESPYIDNYIGMPGASFYIEAFRQAFTWICPQASYGITGDTWQSSNTGLVDDYDMAYPDVDDVAAIAYYYACQQLSTVGSEFERTAWKKEAMEAGGIAAGIKLYDQDMDLVPRGGNFNNTSAYGNKGFWNG